MDLFHKRDCVADPEPLIIPGNKREDALSRLEGRLGELQSKSQDRSSATGASMEFANARLHTLEQTAWFASWDRGTTGRDVRRHLERPSKSYTWWKLRREEQCMISQFRTGHCPIGGMRPGVDSRCRHCREDEATVDHLFHECPRLEEASRNRTVEPLAIRLYGSLQQLRDIARFISQAIRDRLGLSVKMREFTQSQTVLTSTASFYEIVQQIIS